MNDKSPITCQIQVPFRYQVFFTQDVFDPANDLLREILNRGKADKVLVVIEKAIITSVPSLTDHIRAYLSVPGSGGELVGEPVVFEGGETLKNNFSPVEKLHALIEQHGLSRHSYLAAIGGGALLDVAGFAAATAHRGIRHIRLPTTTLSQADSGVGVKNAINAFGKKNFVGAFAPPFAVINDSKFLQFLPDAKKSAGYVEAIKVALIRDQDFFDQIERDADALNRFELETMERLIRRSAELHIRHISEGGDPFEFGSARPLDFGHWAAHKLEQLSYFRISHAEAVAIGMALDVIYSRNAGYLAANDADRILALMAKLGFRLFAPELLHTDAAGGSTILAGLSEFQQHIGGELTITLLRGIGSGFEVHEM
ncbi:MAG TPA: 3-dehydroquinate synthase, partial [Chthoniobacterales bacterium]